MTPGHAVQTLAARLELDGDVLWQASGQAEALRAGQFTPPVQDALGVMSAARRRGGPKLVATHRDRSGAMARVQEVGLWPLVDDLISVSDGYPRKPAPGMFLAALSRHALKPAVCLAVGDRELDICAAHAAGMPAALLVTPGANLAVEVDFMLSDLNALLDVLNAGPGA